MTKIKNLSFPEQLHYLGELRSLYYTAIEQGIEEIEKILIERIKDVLDELPQK